MGTNDMAKLRKKLSFWRRLSVLFGVLLLLVVAGYVYQMWLIQSVEENSDDGPSLALNPDGEDTFDKEAFLEEHNIDLTAKQVEGQIFSTPSLVPVQDEISKDIQKLKDGFAAIKEIQAQIDAVEQTGVVDAQ